MCLVAALAMLAALSLRHGPRRLHRAVAADAVAIREISADRKAEPSRIDDRRRSGGAPSYSFGRPNPVIERVFVDKTEVCRGESNVVHVDASTVDRTDAELKIALGGTGFFGNTSTGRSMPFRLFTPISADNPPMVLVFGARGTHAEQRIPFVKVKDCDAPPFIVIDLERIPESDGDVFKLVAKSGGGPLTNATWEFGDGRSASTQGPEVTHDYSTRPQTSRFSEFMITVSATDSEGAKLAGSRTVEFVNRKYLAENKGT